jgi:anti-sigma factor RsiW
LALVAMAVGALYQLGHRHLVPVGDPEAAAQAYGRLLDAEGALALQSGDPARLETWLADELGTPVDLPATPDGFRLVGADRAELPSGPTGAVVYRSAAGEANGTVLLLVQAAGDHGQAARTEPEAFTEASVPDGSGAGLHELSWSLDSNRFTLVSALAPDELRRFVGGGERAQ